MNYCVQRKKTKFHFLWLWVVRRNKCHLLNIMHEVGNSHHWHHALKFKWKLKGFIFVKTTEQYEMMWSEKVFAEKQQKIIWQYHYKVWINIWNSILNSSMYTLNIITDYLDWIFFFEYFKNQQFIFCSWRYFFSACHVK